MLRPKSLFSVTLLSRGLHTLADFRRSRPLIVHEAYTVLVEGDDMTEPVADETRSILDGHIVLSRKLGAMNHYPAIDVLASASRVMNALVTPEHKAAAGRVRELLAKYEEIELLLKVGEYKKGADRVADQAIDSREAILAYLRQGTHEPCGFDEAVARLRTLSAR